MGAPGHPQEAKDRRDEKMGADWLAANDKLSRGQPEKGPRGRAVTDPVKYPDLGRRVEKRRLELGYATQAQAAQAARVSVGTWGLLETGKSIPATARVRRKVSDALKWPPDVFDAAVEDVELGRPSGADDLRREVSELRFRVQDLERRLDALGKALR